MQPFITADKVKDAYRRYIETSFPIRRESLRQEFARLVDDERLLWQEPYISLARPSKLPAASPIWSRKGCSNHGSERHIGTLQPCGTIRRKLFAVSPPWNANRTTSLSQPAPVPARSRAFRRGVFDFASTGHVLHEESLAMQ